MSVIRYYCLKTVKIEKIKTEYSGSGLNFILRFFFENVYSTHLIIIIIISSAIIINNKTIAVALKASATRDYLNSVSVVSAWLSVTLTGGAARRGVLRSRSDRARGMAGDHIDLTTRVSECCRRRFCDIRQIDSCVCVCVCLCVCVRVCVCACARARGTYQTGARCWTRVSFVITTLRGMEIQTRSLSRISVIVIMVTKAPEL